MAVALKNATVNDVMRLDAIASFLKTDCDPDDIGFETACTKAVLKKVKRIVNESQAKRGEDVLAAVASHFGVRFEEVRDNRDVAKLKRRYLKQRELGFAVLDRELADGDVDALLFQLTNVADDNPEQFVAILNLQESESRGFWNRSHELVHRLAEPPQKMLPFRRHRFEAANPVEKLVDSIAGELAFYPPLFGPLVSKAAKKKQPLTVKTVMQIQNQFAPTSSLLAATNAIVNHWPAPAIVLTASMRGRKRAPNEAVALRVAMQARNLDARNTELLVWNNMRVPPSSPLYSAFNEHRQCEGFEDLANWESSTGRSLPKTNVFTSAIGLRDRAYAVISEV